jgi:hypothetical protein
LDGSRHYVPDGKHGNPDEKCMEEVVESGSPTGPFLASAYREADGDERPEVRKDNPENRHQQVEILDNEQPPIEKNDK